MKKEPVVGDYPAPTGASMDHGSVVIEAVGGVITLLLIASATLAVTKRINLPFSIALVLVGMALSWLAHNFPAAEAMRPQIDISPDLILFVFLPTLIFESAFNMDSRMLRANLTPVLGLAAPGLLLSTFIIGALVSAVTKIPFTEALLLGAILSATDPVAVIALFKQLGAPRRLTILVEGESLFNDATAIVVSKILVTVVVAGSLSFEAVGQGISSFTVVFFGGLFVGWLLGLATGYALGAVESDPYIEISLTTILAYFSFYIAEHTFHVSGVMSTVAAGITMAAWGRMKISPSVREYLENFWEYMAFIATALIFLLVGLEIKLSALIASWETLVIVIVAMLFSRAVVIFGLVPLFGKLKWSDPVSGAYQAVMYWGGLRGAIALAIVLSLPHFDNQEVFIAVVMGAVLFTLIIQGLSMNRLVRFLGLDKPPLADRFAKTEVELASQKRAIDRIPELLAGGQFSAPIAQRLMEKCKKEHSAGKDSLAKLRGEELGSKDEKRLLFLFLFAEERALYVDMFNKGHLTESAFKELCLTLDLQSDAVRHNADFEAVSLHGLTRRRLGKRVVSILDHIAPLAFIGERFHVRRIASDYELSWGRYQGSSRALDELTELMGLGAFPKEALEEAENLYTNWRAAARKELDQDAEQFPEFVSAMQERLGRRLVRLAQIEVIDEWKERGAMPSNVAEEMVREKEKDVAALRGAEIAELHSKPEELLRKVPFFKGIPEEEFAHMAGKMRAHSFAKAEEIIFQGEKGDSLFLIARGVVRVVREDEGKIRELATLMAGDFFGEMALLHGEPRNATVRAVTPCSLFELRRNALIEAMEKFTLIKSAVEDADRKRKEELDNEPD